MPQNQFQQSLQPHTSNIVASTKKYIMKLLRCRLLQEKHN